MTTQTSKQRQKIKRNQRKKENRKNKMGESKDKFSFLKIKAESIQMIFKIFELGNQSTVWNNMLKEKFQDNCLEEYSIKLNEVTKETNKYVDVISRFEHDPNKLEYIEELISVYTSLVQHMISIDTITKEYKESIIKADEYFKQLREEKETYIKDPIKELDGQRVI